MVQNKRCDIKLKILILLIFIKELIICTNITYDQSFGTFPLHKRQL